MNTNGKQNLKFLDLSGFAFTGKHAVIDLVREFQGYHVPHFAFEFLLLRIQGGIFDLEDALSNDWSPIRSDAAIRRFMNLVRRLGTKARWMNPASWFGSVGWNYQDYFNHQFFSLSEEYLQKLIEARWVTNWPFPLADVGDGELFFRRLFRRLGFKNAMDFEVYLAAPSDFVSITCEYLENVLSSNIRKGTSTIVMHNAFEPYKPQRGLKFFHDARCIIVDRDPRDNYVAMSGFRSLRVPVEKFVKRYRLNREISKKFFLESPRILRIQFEDLVLDYDANVEKILRFLGEDARVHVNKKKYFDPNISKKNIGISRVYDRPDEINFIAQELSEYCYRREIPTLTR